MRVVAYICLTCRATKCAQPTSTAASVGDPLDIVQPSLLFLTLPHLCAALAARTERAQNQCGHTCGATDRALMCPTHITYYPLLRTPYRHEPPQMTPQPPTQSTTLY